jgi:hypothetical protein
LGYFKYDGYDLERIREYKANGFDGAIELPLDDGTYKVGYRQFVPFDTQQIKSTLDPDK